MLKICATFVLFILIIKPAYSQFSEMGGDKIVNNGFISISGTETNKNVSGSPFITEDYVLAKISAYDNEIFKVKYDGVLDEILVKTDTELYALKKTGPKNLIITLLGDNKTYQIFDFINDNQVLDSGFFINITNSENSDYYLLKKEKIKFVSEVVPTSSYDRAKPAHYKRLDDVYYIKIKNDPLVLLPKKNKDIANLFPEHSKTILAFMKSEKIKTKNEVDLIKLVNYINTL